jgi:CRISPR-associated exonuclease Cas4
MLPFVLALLLLFLGLIAWVLSIRQRRGSGLPEGRVIYIDTSRLRRTEGTFFSPRYSLAGRPDYLVNRNGVILPVEVKSAMAPAVPHPSHLHQLAAYALLVEEHFGARPPFGVLQYKDKTLEIPITDELVKATQAILESMQAAGDQKELRRSHEEPGRCRGCGFRGSCGQALL